MITTVGDHRYIKHFSHFAERLHERYGLFITFECYLALCKVPYLRNFKRQKATRAVSEVGYLKIHGNKVKVVRVLSPGFTPIITALPINANAPLM